ncbi:MAG: hypothetical protein ACI835_005246 [Planctomycetota bacterium]|jgi:hypothetical protein
MTTADKEPRAPSAPLPFEAWDFECLAPSKAGSAEFNAPRLAARRKLAALGKVLVAKGKEDGIGLLSRTSIHNPHSFNGKRVQRLWAYVARDKPAKAKLRKVVGRDLAKDLDSAYRNAYLCFAVEHECIEVSLRIHADAWFDGTNLVKRTKAEGVRGWLELLNQLKGFHLQLDSWKGEWPCGDMSVDRLEEFLKFYTPGEHWMAVQKRWPVPAGPVRDAVMGEEVPAMLIEEAQRLLPLYRYMAWGDESDFLFG